MVVTIEEAGRDVSAALADLRGRRDQTVAEFDERLRLLEQIHGDLQSGSLDPRSAQTRVRRLINERGGGSSRPVRAGRTQIGMRIPAESTPAAPHGLPIRAPLGPSPTVANAAIQKTMGALDARIVTLLTETQSKRERREARLEIALLRAARSSLVRQHGSMPDDVVLLGSVIEFAEETGQMLEDLVQPGRTRLRRLLGFARETVSQLSALGVSCERVKKKLSVVRSDLEKKEAALEKALDDLLAAFETLSPELKKHGPADDGSLLDDLV